MTTVVVAITKSTIIIADSKNGMEAFGALATLADLNQAATITIRFADNMAPAVESVKNFNDIAKYVELVTKADLNAVAKEFVGTTLGMLAAIAAAPLGPSASLIADTAMAEAYGRAHDAASSWSARQDWSSLFDFVDEHLLLRPPVEGAGSEGGSGSGGGGAAGGTGSEGGGNGTVTVSEPRVLYQEFSDDNGTYQVWYDNEGNVAYEVFTPHTTGPKLPDNPTPGGANFVMPIAESIGFSEHGATTAVDQSAEVLIAAMADFAVATTNISGSADTDFGRQQLAVASH